MSENKITAKEIDALLPQTQCGLCGFGGCLPYAEALAQKEAPINLCPPGGIKGVYSLAELLHENADPFIADMEKKSKPPSRVIIREAECIGCTKCIQACPVDAIVGSAKLMHTVISSECTGCDLCIPACPVDCMESVPLSEPTQHKDHYRNRFQARKKRLENKSKEKNVKPFNKKSYLETALLRGMNKK